MYQKVLVPLDCSTFGEHALPWALKFATASGATLELIHVSSLKRNTGAHLSNTGIELYSDLFRQHAQLYLDGTVERIAQVSQVCCTTKILDGDVSERLAHYASQSNTDLIVIATHGRGAFGRFWLGSVADQLIRKSPIPSLLIRPESTPVNLNQHCSIKHVLAPLDGDIIAESILPHAVQVCKLWGSELTLLQVLPPIWPELGALGGDVSLPVTPLPVEELRNLQAQRHQEALRYLNAKAEHSVGEQCSVRVEILTDVAPGPAILKEAEDQSVDLIAMATHGRQGISRLFLGSVADKVIRGTRIPVLVRHPG